MQQQSMGASGGGAVYPDVDMSHLSEEERMLIESVMAKAQMEEMEAKQQLAAGGNSRSVTQCVLLLYFAKGQLLQRVTQTSCYSLAIIIRIILIQ